MNTIKKNFFHSFRMKTLFSIHNKLYKFIFFIFLISLISFFFTPATDIYASQVQSIQDINAPSVNPIVDINFSGQNITGQTDPTLQLLFLITIITLAPTLLIMMTCFTRLIIVLHFIRSALGTQQMPPNQVLIGLALFLTFSIMGPTFTAVNETAIKPYSAGEITSSEMVENAMIPIREYMLARMDIQNMKLFTAVEGETFETVEDIPNRVIIPSYILSEITAGFIIGFIIYVPFIVIDMVVASVLMAMGMMMLPPAMISLPFKIMFFVLVDGWSLVISNVVATLQSPPI